MKILFCAEPVLVITDAQGIDYIEELDILSDGETRNLYKAIRRPGGINPITNVDNLRIQVSLRAKNNMKLDSFFRNHKVTNGRVAVATDLTLDNVRLLPELNKSEKGTKGSCGISSN